MILRGNNQFHVFSIVAEYADYVHKKSTFMQKILYLLHKLNEPDYIITPIYQTVVSVGIDYT